MKYFVLKGHDTEGPFSEAELREAFATRRFAAMDLVRLDAGGHWKPLRKLLAELDAAPAPPAPPAPASRAPEDSVKAWSIQACDRCVELLGANPLRTGLVSIALACVFALIARWPVLVPLPCVAVGVAAGLILITRSRPLAGGLIALAAILLPLALTPARMAKPPVRETEPAPDLASATPRPAIVESPKPAAAPEAKTQVVPPPRVAATPAPKVPVVGTSVGDIKTIDGDLYANATLSKIEPDAITVQHDAGISKILFAKLSKETQAKYGYDPVRVAEAAKVAATAAAEAQRQRQTERAEQIQRELSDPAVTTVRNGVIYVDKTTPVGAAFDRYRFFKETHWRNIPAADGAKIVEAVGIFDASKIGAKDAGDALAEAAGVALSQVTRTFTGAQYLARFLVKPDNAIEPGSVVIRLASSGGATRDVRLTEKQSEQTLRELYQNRLPTMSAAFYTGR